VVAAGGKKLPGLASRRTWGAEVGAIQLTWWAPGSAKVMSYSKTGMGFMAEGKTGPPMNPFGVNSIDAPTRLPPTKAPRLTVGSEGIVVEKLLGEPALPVTMVPP